jgi:feruloyl esterase
MHRPFIRLVLAVALLAPAALIPPLAAAAPCALETFTSLSLPDTTITAATVVPAGLFTPPDGTPPFNVLAFCRVEGTVAPAIRFEVWLPTTDWNGKFFFAGNGGAAGFISYGPGNPQAAPGATLADAITRGYAAASTDTGHTVSGPADYSWALDHPELVVDFGYRAVHEVTEKAKAIVPAFYSTGPRLSYFVGCSTGGRQAYMEAQRYPEDFDGLVGGAPANNNTHGRVNNVWNFQALLNDPASYVPASKLPLLTNAVLAACDALDGVVDGLLTDPHRCNFDPRALQCTGADADTCLTAAQVEAVERIYKGAHNSAGQEIFPGFPPGSEINWTALVGSPGTSPADALQTFLFNSMNNFFQNAVFGPGWDFRTFNFDTDTATQDDEWAFVLNATDPDLRPFEARGGKLISYHGWNDQLIPTPNSINYYESVVVVLGDYEQTAQFFRLFLAPGMTHCGGGQGPAIDAGLALLALEQWVEQGIAPTQILASHLTGGVVDRTRPLCPYPQVALYRGTGSIDEAQNFRCSLP